MLPALPTSGADLAQLAAALCDGSAALLIDYVGGNSSIIDSFGMIAGAAPALAAWCAQQMSTASFVVHASAAPPVLAMPPAALGFAGVAIRGPDGQPRGALCVLAPGPLTLSDAQRAGLAALGRLASALLAPAVGRAADPFRVLFDEAPDAMLLIDPSHSSGTWVILDCNAAACQLHGYTRAELLGQPIELLDIDTSTEEPASRAAYYARLCQGERFQGEAQHRRKDGTVFPVAYATTLITVGGQALVLGIDRDMTAQHAAAAAERAASEHLQFQAQSLAGVHDAVIATTPDGTIRLWNPAATTLYGWADSEVVGRTASEILAISAMSPLMPRPPARRCSRPASGAARWSSAIAPATRWSLTPRSTASWAPTASRWGWWRSNRDGAMRNQLAEALRESELRTRAILETALDCIITIDEHDQIVEWNPAAERTFGYLRSAVLGRTLTEMIIPPRLGIQHQQGLARYLATSQPRLLGARIEQVARRADGSEFPVELTVTRLPISGPPLFTAFLRNITDQQRAAAALRESEAYFRALIEHGDEIISVLTAAGELRYSSPAQLRVLGWPPEDRQGQLVFDRIHPDDLPRALQMFAALLAQPGVPLRAEIRTLHQDGTWRVLDMTATNLLDNSAVGGLVVNSYDVTERKQAELRLTHAALHDALTGLPNRTLFFDRVQQALIAPSAPACPAARCCLLTSTTLKRSTIPAGISWAMRCWWRSASACSRMCGPAIAWPASAAMSLRCCSPTCRSRPSRPRCPGGFTISWPSRSWSAARASPSARALA